MARKSKSEEEITGIEEFGLDEVDSFADEKRQELIRKAGLDKEETRFSDSDDESAVEGVMDVDSDADIEKYKRKFQGAIDESDEEYFREDGDQDDEEEEDGNWGGEYYGAEEAEDEEDEKLMEEEALRLQKKHMEDLHMDDFMLDEVEEWKSEKKQDLEEKKQDRFEELVKSGSKQERLNMLSKKYPEYLPLISELKTYKPVYDELKKCYKEKPILAVQFKALSLYFGAIISYFNIFVSKLQSNEPFDMKDEDVMVSILSTRELWRQARSLIENDDVSDDDDDEEESDSNEVEGEVDEQISGSEAEIHQDQEADEDSEDVEQEEETDGEDEDEDEDEEEEIPDFDTLRTVTKKNAKKLEQMDDIDAEDKQGRRKSLRFYTSKIDKRDIKKVSVDGDMDAAYLEETDKQKDRRFVQEKREQRSRKSSRGRPNRGRR